MRKLRTTIVALATAGLMAISATGVFAAPADLSSPAADLRVTLNRLLAQHAGLAIEAMRQGVDTGDLEDPEFTAAAGALAGNTDDLTAAIESVYGADAADAFRTQWEAHIGFFVDYTVAVAEDDAEGQEAALAELAQYQEDFAAFLDSATDGNAPAGPVAEALQAHVDQLVAALDSYAAGDFEAAYAAEREASAHMFMTGQVLAAAIAGQFPDQFPTAAQMPDAAMEPGATPSLIVLIGMGLVAVATVSLSRHVVQVRSRD